MRKTFRLLFVLFLVFAFCTTFAQDLGTSSGRAPLMKQGGSHRIINQLDNPATEALAYDNASGQTLTMPLPAGTPFTYLTAWANPVFASSMCEGGDGTYYLIDVGPPQTLWTVDPSTGVVSSLGSITGASGDAPNGISFNPADGMFYMVGASTFYSIDVSTRVATVIGTFSITGLMIDLCFDAAGTCYAYDVDITPGAANGYTIDITTGAVTPLGYVGFTPNYGQGMGYDYETSTIYLSAFNSDTFSAQLRTMDPTTGMTTLITDWTSAVQIAPFMPITDINPCLTVDPATNPDPASGTTNVPLTYPNLSWTNGAGATTIDVIFEGGTIYSGSPITTLAMPPLSYGHTYHWKVNGSDGNCTRFGSTWNFTTVQNPNLVIDTIIVYPMAAQYWTGYTDGATKTDNEINTIYPNDGWAAFDVTGFPPSTDAIDAITFWGYLNANNFPYWAITPMGSVNPVTGDAASIYSQINNNYTQGTAYSYNLESGTLTNGWLSRALEASAPTDLYNALGQGWFAIGFVDFDFYASYYVNFDGWNSNNIPYLEVIYEYIVPVELTSFTAKASDNSVELSWITATETNNQGFEVQRSNGGEFEPIAFVNGNGTTTEVHAYSYTDRNLKDGSYSYRLKQVDFDGTFEYSNVAEVNVAAPAVYSLEQNYPNPFNPSTKINFRLAVDSKVSLKVFDVLGQEVATLLNGNFVAGSHTVNFNASSINSGVYMYRIEATGIDGSNFTSVKKMILTK
jgi:hypothetical protein